MKYFTRDWALGEMSERDSAVRRDAYWRHIDSLVAQLPATVRRLAKHVNLHDGLVRRALVDRRAGSLALELRCGDLQVGYSDTDLVYSGVDFSSVDLALLEKRAGDPETELLYDEVDLDDAGRFVHRISFEPHGEVDIRFSALRIREIPRSDREISRRGLVFANPEDA